VVQRRHAQRTAFVWAVSLDAALVNLHVTDVSEAGGEQLDESQALLVQAGVGGHDWLLLANPEHRNVDAVLPDGTHWQNSAAFGVR